MQKKQLHAKLIRNNKTFQIALIIVLLLFALYEFQRRFFVGRHRGHSRGYRGDYFQDFFVEDKVVPVFDFNEAGSLCLF